MLLVNCAHYSWIRSGEVCMVNISKETPRRIITVRSSLNKISTGQLGNKVVVRGGGVTPSAFIQASGQLYKDDMNSFFSTSDVCFVFWDDVSHQWCDLFYRLLHSYTRHIERVVGGERDILLSAQEWGHGGVAWGDCVSQAAQAEWCYQGTPPPHSTFPWTEISDFQEKRLKSMTASF